MEIPSPTALTQREPGVRGSIPRRILEPRLFANCDTAGAWPPGPPLPSCAWPGPWAMHLPAPVGSYTKRNQVHRLPLADCWACLLLWLRCLYAFSLAGSFWLPIRSSTAFLFCSDKDIHPGVNEMPLWSQSYFGQCPLSLRCISKLCDFVFIYLSLIFHI